MRTGCRNCRDQHTRPADRQSRDGMRVSLFPLSLLDLHGKQYGSTERTTIQKLTERKFRKSQHVYEGSNHFGPSYYCPQLFYQRKSPHPFLSIPKIVLILNSLLVG